MGADDPKQVKIVSEEFLLKACKKYHNMGKLQPTLLEMWTTQHELMGIISNDSRVKLYLVLLQNTSQKSKVR